MSVSDGAPMTVSAPSALVEDSAPVSEPRSAPGMRRAIDFAVDLVRLAKPRITGMVLLTAFGGFWLATRASNVPRSTRVITLMLIGTALVVGGANALNMYLERD